MTRVLMVDDDPVQLRSLARIFGIQCGGMAVVTASSGAEAIDLLRETTVDMVLTDVQMPDMNGLELIAWLVTHQPHVPILAMTAFPDRVSTERLIQLGNIECFTKPLDVPAVVERVSATLARGVRGHVRDISLAAFLQLLEMERKSCTLTIETLGQVGQLHIRDGAIIDATTNELAGEAAAYLIVSWPSPAITIACESQGRSVTVQKPMGFIIMEAMRLHDEVNAKRTPKAEAALRPAADAWDGQDWMGEEDDWSDVVPDDSVSPNTLSDYPPGKPANAEALAIVERSTGRVRTHSGGHPRLEHLATLAANILLAEEAAVGGLGLDEALEEVVVTTKEYWVLIRPLQSSPTDFAMLVFDPERDNVVMERLELAAFVAALDAWVATN